MHAKSGFLARHPLAVTSTGTNLAIECHGIFHHYPRETCSDILQKDAILITQFLLKTFDHLYFDTGSQKFFDALTGNERIKIAQANDHSTNPMLDNGIGTRRLMAVVTTRFQRHIHSSTLAIGTTSNSILKSISFGMQVAITLVITLGNHLAITHNECPHKRIGIHCTLSLLGQCHGFSHQHNIVGSYHNSSPMDEIRRKDNTFSANSQEKKDF